MLSEYQIDCLTLNMSHPREDIPRCQSPREVSNVMRDEESLERLEWLRSELREAGQWPPDRGREDFSNFLRPTP